MVNGQKWDAKLEKWGTIPTFYLLTLMCCCICLPNFQWFQSCAMSVIS